MASRLYVDQPTQWPVLPIGICTVRGVYDPLTGPPSKLGGYLGVLVACGVVSYVERPGGQLLQLWGPCPP